MLVFGCVVACMCAFTGLPISFYQLSSLPLFFNPFFSCPLAVCGGHNAVKPQTPTLQVEGTPVEGSALTLTCTTPSTLPSADPSRVRYVWSRDITLANISSSRYTFKPTLNDNGDYTCTVMFDSVSSEPSASNTMKGPL